MRACNLHKQKGVVWAKLMYMVDEEPKEQWFKLKDLSSKRRTATPNSGISSTLWDSYSKERMLQRQHEEQESKYIT